PGMLILVTRPEPQAADWARALQAQGEQAMVLPLIEIAPPPDERAVHAAWRALPATRMVMFVSPNAAHWFARGRPAGSNWPADTLAAAAVPGTAHAVSEELADTV